MRCCCCRVRLSSPPTIIIAIASRKQQQQQQQQITRFQFQPDACTSSNKASKAPCPNRFHPYAPVTATTVYSLAIALSLTPLITSLTASTRSAPLSLQPRVPTLDPNFARARKVVDGVFNRTVRRVAQSLRHAPRDVECHQGCLGIFNGARESLDVFRAAAMLLKVLFQIGRACVFVVLPIG